MELIDSHCHLEEIENLELVIEKAKSIGVVALIDVEEISAVLSVVSCNKFRQNGKSGNLIIQMLK